MTVDLRIDPSFEREALRSLFVKNLLDELVDQGAENYRDGVPTDTFDLFDSIFGVVALTSEGWRGRIGAADWKAALIEFGTSRNAPDGSLRRAVEALGLTIEET